MKQSVSVVIVDLDNTLWDWVKIWGASFSAMLGRLAADSGVPVETLKREFKEIHQRHGTSEYAFSVEELPSLVARHPNGEIAEIYSGAIDDFRTARRQHLHLYDGVSETLELLKDRGCLLIGYTESMAFYSAYRLRKTGIDRILDYVYSPPDHDLPSGMTPEQIRRYPATRYELRRTVHRHTPKGELKPNPGILTSIVTSAGAQMGEVIYVGDSELKDVAMAQAAGITSVLASYGKAQDTSEYKLLKEVTHWAPELVERERAILAGAVAVEPASATLESSFAEILDKFEFVPHPQTSRDSLPFVLDAWKTTVSVQQHFNDIELRIRNLAVTMFAAIASGAGLVHQASWEIDTPVGPIPLSTFMLLVGASAWIALYLMEQYWYHVFLRSAGQHAGFIEARWGASLPELGLSTRISQASTVTMPLWPKWLSRRIGTQWKSTERLRWFYIVGVGMLLGGAILTLFAHQSASHAAQPAAVPPAAGAPSPSAPVLPPAPLTAHPLSTSPRRP